MINTKNIKIQLGCAVIAAFCLTLSGCSPIVQADETGAVNNEAFSENTKPIGIYDSEDEAIVVKKGIEAGTVQFQNISTSRRYTLNYDGATKLYDKYDNAISMEQLKEGSVATVRFYKQDKSLSYLKENPDCISYTNVRNYSLDLKNGTISIGNETYNISGHVVVVSDGKETDPMELSTVDVISAWGYKNMIYGINVEQGHGYLRLQNAAYFVGGWIDIEDKVVKKITEDMLIVVPEGTFNVSVSHKGSSATQEISFARNEEMAWDLGDVEITVVQKGSIIFTITPAGAKVSIDGREVNISKPVELEYGLHQMRITAEGYDTVAQYIRVGEPSANISVDLEKSEEASTQEESSEAKSETADKDSSDKNEDEEPEEDEKPAKKTQQSNSDNDEDDDDEDDDDDRDDDDREEESSENASSASVVSASSKYRVYIDAPEEVEAYLDGSYIGITPISFPKQEGSYVVTLRKNGYQTRSYTLQIDDEEKDINYSFTELVKIEE